MFNKLQEDAQKSEMSPENTSPAFFLFLSAIQPVVLWYICTYWYPGYDAYWYGAVGGLVSHWVSVLRWSVCAALDGTWALCWPVVYIPAPRDCVHLGRSRGGEHVSVVDEIIVTHIPSLSPGLPLFLSQLGFGFSLAIKSNKWFDVTEDIACVFLSSRNFNVYYMPCAHPALSLYPPASTNKHASWLSPSLKSTRINPPPACAFALHSVQVLGDHLFRVRIDRW